MTQIHVIIKKTAARLGEDTYRFWLLSEAKTGFWVLTKDVCTSIVSIDFYPWDKYRQEEVKY